MYKNNIKHFEDTILFIKNHDKLANCHLVDFITDDLWNKCLSNDLKLQIQQTNNSTNNNNHNNNEIINFNKLNFIKTTDALNIKNNINVIDANDFNDDDNNNNKNLMKNRFMKNKKTYEIDILSNVIYSIWKKILPNNNETIVIDVGAGKGYLGTNLCENYGIPVLSIDSCPSRYKSALKRQKLLKKIKNKSYTLVRHLVEFIDEKTDYEKYIVLNYPNWNNNNNNDNLFLVGLHTCGNLANSMIKSFVNSKSLGTLCVVPCCYHLTNETLTNKYLFTKNARMLAQQSVERNSMKKNKKMPTSIFYRAILQVLLKSLGMENVVIGRGSAPSYDFKIYAKWALNKIGLESNKIPKDNDLDKLYNKYADKEWQINVFQSLRVHLGSVIETALILDKILYLESRNECFKVSIVRIFDPLLSPRCYAILAFK
ncbi:hypothetical protein HCN44_006421 [Aphidius gifuensis]|uniref:Methyltransferase domain-containing protein n=1 Tax=Aphidius gifuensis TaxID=684658 RepID=A0A835CTQ8_APHGI|nr:methyltransferase-like protein 25 [Aphidius gifuensis]KAF7995314.1 hypothetical protein HCN44_006421 [Aphidius gifuensis]